VGGRHVHAARVLLRVDVVGRVALVVVGERDEVGEDAARVLPVADAAVLVEAEERRHVVARDGAPVARAVADALPALDAREHPFGARPVRADSVSDVVQRPRKLDALPRAVRDGHEVLRAGDDERVRLLVVQVARQPLVGLARDGGQREAPAEAERPVARA
jgi:hypothetical protein